MRKHLTKAIPILLLLILVNLSVLISISTQNVSSENLASTTTVSTTNTAMLETLSTTRSVVFEFYSLFDVPMINDVWQARAPEYRVLSWAYPIVYIWETYPGEIWYYTSGRLNVNATNLNEITIDKPEFLPKNLLGQAPSTQGGTAKLAWYMQYVDNARATALSIPQGWYDGWITEITGTITMDELATRKILGITSIQYQSLISNPANWWTTNKKTVEDKWEAWLLSEGNTRLDIYPFFEYQFSIFNTKTLPGLELTPSYNPSTGVTFTMDMVTWGMECLLARWFHETFLKGYEYWYSDLYLNAAVGSSSTNLNLDMAVDTLLYMWTSETVAYADPVWCFETFQGDVPLAAYQKNYINSPAYPYHDKTYYTVAPGGLNYSDYRVYDYTPETWDLNSGEILKISFGDTDAKGPVWAYKQNQDGSVTKVTGKLELNYEIIPMTTGYAVFEPFPEHLGSQYSYDSTTKTVTITGPFNMTAWSQTNLSEEWYRLEDPTHPDGLLPWGSPYIELAVVYKVTIIEGDLNEDGTVNILDLLIVRAAFGTKIGDSGYNSKADLNKDGTVNILDLLAVNLHYGETKK